MKGHFPLPSILKGMEGLVFAFSSSADGDMRDKQARDAFMISQTGEMHALLTMDQVHGAHVTDASHMCQTTEVPHIDGIVRKIRKGDPPVFLGVRVADCVPIFVVDPRQKIYAVAHAGWKGTRDKVIISLVSEMIARGSRISDIRIYIGPHICSSCYNIPEDRARVFTQAYGPTVVRTVNSEWYLDLAQAIRLDALSIGLFEDQMEESHICTSCGRWPSFSFRKSNGNLKGEMMGIVGFV